MFLGIANWFIFLDHIPDNVVNWITVRNYGFSGAADLFVFISGYTAAIVYARMMLERGFIVGATRIFERAWQLYAAYIVLFIIYIVTIGDVATQYAAPDIIYEFNVAGLVDHPIRTVGHGLLLQSRARNLDVLQLYIALMAAFAPVLWMMLRSAWPDDDRIHCALSCRASVRMDFVVLSGWILVFQPILLAAAFRVWRLARAGRRRKTIPHPSQVADPLVYLGIAYLVFALVMTMAGRFPAFGAMFPGWLFDAFNPNDKTNLAPYRVLHFIVLAFFVTRFVPKDWRGLQWRNLPAGHQMRPAIARGVLRRRLPLLCRTFRTDDELGLAVGADFRERDRHRHHDHRRLLHLLVAATGRPASHGIAPMRIEEFALAQKIRSKPGPRAVASAEPGADALCFNKMGTRSPSAIVRHVK